MKRLKELEWKILTVGLDEVETDDLSIVSAKFKENLNLVEIPQNLSGKFSILPIIGSLYLPR